MKQVSVAYILGIGLFLGSLTYLLHREKEQDYQAALNNFLIKAEQDTQVLALNIDNKLKSIYQNIRTISVTPQVRKIDRHATNFDLDGRFFIQQIYNNLKSAVDVSEVYIVSKEFDGDKIDPVTKELELPNTMFDDLITGLSADKIKVKAKHPELDEADEIEIYEFRNIKNQIAIFGKLYKNLADIKTLDNIPCMISNPLITCDNSYYEKTRNDADRTGIMVSVPFYNPQDEFEGVISAIILLNNMRLWLPNHNYALINPAYNLAIYKENSQIQNPHKDWIQHGIGQKDLLFAKEVPLSSPDIKGGWKLRAGLPNETFLNSAEVNNIQLFTYTGYGVIFFIGLLIFAIRRMMEEMEHRKALLIKNKSLQDELLISARRSGMADMTTSVLHNVGNVLNSVNTSVTLVQQKVKDSTVSNVSKVAAMITTNQEKLDTFFTEDPQGKMIPDYLCKLADKWSQDKDYLLNEMESLIHNVTHIKEIIIRQNNTFGKSEAILDDVIVANLIEDAVKINMASFPNTNITLTHELDKSIIANLDRVKLMQVLVNIIKNGYEALLASQTDNKILKIALTKKDEAHFIISIQDNGMGIAPENIARLTSQGFTTKKNGHGFGIHASALAIQQMNGDFIIKSDGIGKGASFTLILPNKPGEKK